MKLSMLKFKSDFEQFSVISTCSITLNVFLQAFVRGWLTRRYIAEIHQTYRQLVSDIDGDAVSVTWLGNRPHYPTFSQYAPLTSKVRSNSKCDKDLSVGSSFENEKRRVSSLSQARESSSSSPAPFQNIEESKPPSIEHEQQPTCDVDDNQLFRNGETQTCPQTIPSPSVESDMNTECFTVDRDVQVVKETETDSSGLATPDCQVQQTDDCLLEERIQGKNLYSLCRKFGGGRLTRFGPKVGQIVPKWNKSKTFSDQISVHFESASQSVLKSDVKKSRICPHLLGPI